MLAIAAHIPREEIGGSYFQETHPQELFRECSVYSELVSVPEQLPRVLEIAMRAAIERRGVAVVVIPGEIFLHHAAPGAEAAAIRPTTSVIRPDRRRDSPLQPRSSTRLSAVTILAGAGCAGAHDELVAMAERLKAPVVHALRGKEFVEYDNPYDVGMTGLLGFASGYRAMEHCDALLMLGTDFPYRPFYPEKARVVQVDIRGENIGRRVPVDVGLVGTVKDTIDALLPHLDAKRDDEHLDPDDRPLPTNPRPSRRTRTNPRRPRPLHPQITAAAVDRHRRRRRRLPRRRRDTDAVGRALPAHERTAAPDRVVQPRDHGQRAPPGHRRAGIPPGPSGRRPCPATAASSMMMGELLTLRQQKLPVKVVVLQQRGTGVRRARDESRRDRQLRHRSRQPQLRRGRASRSASTAFGSSAPANSTTAYEPRSPTTGQPSSRS